MVMESSTWGVCVRLDAPPAGHVCQLRKCRPDPQGPHQRRLRLGKVGEDQGTWPRRESECLVGSSKVVVFREEQRTGAESRGRYHGIVGVLL